MKRLLPHPLLVLLLAGVWLLLNNTLSFGHLLLGLLLGWLIPLFTMSFWSERVRIFRPGVLIVFLGRVAFDILVANMVVARLVLGPPRRLRPAFIRVPLELKHELAISVLANTICLTPGTLSARLSPDRKFLLVHALDAPDPAGVIGSIKARYEKPLKEIFEC